MDVQIKYTHKFKDLCEKQFGKNRKAGSDDYVWRGIKEIKIEKHEGKPAFTYLILTDGLKNQFRFDVFDVDKVLFLEGGDANAFSRWAAADARP